jgi:hypothetical protein
MLVEMLCNEYLRAVRYAINQPMTRSYQHFVPDGTLDDDVFLFYQHLVPNGTGTLHRNERRIHHRQSEGQYLQTTSFPFI